MLSDTELEENKTVPETKNNLFYLFKWKDFLKIGQ